jgi:hypothetical protein
VARVPQANVVAQSRRFELALSQVRMENGWRRTRGDTIFEIDLSGFSPEFFVFSKLFF